VKIRIKMRQMPDDVPKGYKIAVMENRSEKVKGRLGTSARSPLESGRKR
jgi:hypothetical protein